MKFLSNEWFDTFTAAAKSKFSKPGKLDLSFCEVYRGCPDGTDKWLLINMESGIITDTSHGEGAPPAADYLGYGDYAGHVDICLGKVDPKKAVLAGTFKIEDNKGGGNPMRTLKLIDMYMKLVEAKKISGVEY